MISVVQAQESIISIQQYVEQNNRREDQLSAEDANALPIGVTLHSTPSIEILVRDIQLTPTQSTISISTVLPIPMTEQVMALEAVDVPLQSGGYIESNTKLFLNEPIHIVMGEKMRCTFTSGVQGCCIEMDCNGLKKIRFKGTIDFCRTVLLPENNLGEILPEPIRVKAHFDIIGTSWDDLITTITISPFQIVGMPDWGFEVKEAVLDRSDNLNPNGIIFPTGYTGPTDSFWKGIFIKKVSVRLPELFSKMNGNTVPAIQLNNFIIDPTGVSGNIQLAGLIPLNTTKSWSMSVDTLEIVLRSNRIIKGTCSGSLLIPITSSDDIFSYQGCIAENNNFLFRVKQKNKIQIPCWLAKAEIDSSSSVSIHYVEKQLLIKLLLNGSLSLNTTKHSIPTKIVNLNFHSLILSNTAPYIRGGFFYVDKITAQLKGFNISIQDVGFITRLNETILKFKIKIQFCNVKDFGFQGEVGLFFISETSDRWKLKQITLSEVSIDIDKGIFSVKGQIKAQPDKGFEGQVLLSVFPGVKVEAKAEFCKLNNHNYWYVNASTTFKKGIPIYPIIGIYGFSGGVSYGMRLDTVLHSNNKWNSEKIFKSDSTVGIGIRAGILIGSLPIPELYNLSGELCIEFDKSWGLNKAILYGKLNVLQNIDKSSTSSIYGTVILEFDNVNKSLHATAEVFINYTPILKGIGNNNRAGYLTLHIDSKDWYIHIGHPNDRIGVEVLSLARFDAYLVAGSIIPELPSPSPLLQEILDIESRYQTSSDLSIRNGSGIGFGARCNIQTGKKKCLFFYGEFNAGIEFDILMKNYGSSTLCTNTSKPVGINGWYAQGKIGAFVQGEIGLFIDLPFYKGEAEILEIGAGVLLEAKLPNPSWFSGTLGGYYSVFGGVLEGEVKFKLEIGEGCDFRSSLLQNRKNIINSIDCKGDITSVLVDVDPVIHFNVPIDKELSISNMDSHDVKFKVVIDSFKLYSNQESVDVDFLWNDNKNELKIKSTTLFKTNTLYKVHLATSIYIYNNNNWVVFNSNIIDGDTVFLFKTSPKTVQFSKNLIAYSYPEIHQKYYLIDEHHQNYIKFKKHLPLFDSLQYLQLYIQQDKSSDQNQINFTYIKDSSVFYFDLHEQLAVDKKYTLRFIYEHHSESIDILDIYFETALYNTFDNYINNLFVNSPYFDEGNQYVGGTKIVYPIRYSEILNQSMVVMSFDIYQNEWYKAYSKWYDFAKELNYACIDWRVVNHIEPLQRVCLIKNNTTINNVISYYVYYDVLQIKSFILQSYTDNEEIYNWIYDSFTPIKKGFYNIDISYVLPGTNIKTTNIKRKWHVSY